MTLSLDNTLFLNNFLPFDSYMLYDIRSVRCRNFEVRYFTEVLLYCTKPSNPVSPLSKCTNILRISDHPERACRSAGSLWSAALFLTLLCIFVVASEHNLQHGNYEQGPFTAGFVFTSPRHNIGDFSPLSLLQLPHSNRRGVRASLRTTTWKHSLPILHSFTSPTKLVRVFSLGLSYVFLARSSAGRDSNLSNSCQNKPQPAPSPASPRPKRPAWNSFPCCDCTNILVESAQSASFYKHCHRELYTIRLSVVCLARKDRLQTSPMTFTAQLSRESARSVYQSWDSCCQNSTQRT